MGSFSCEILVVDDDEDIRTTLRDVLSAEGYAVTFAAGAAAALARLRTPPPPQLVLLDWYMPGLDGAAFCAERRRDPTVARTPLVIMSAALDSDVDTSDAVAFLRKPMHLDELLETVKRYAGELPEQVSPEG